MATQSEPATASQPETVIVSRSLWQRIPWLWYDYVARSPVPLWLLSLMLFLILSGLGLLSAFLAGQLSPFLRDIWLIAFGFIALMAFVMGYIPRAIDRVLVSMQPWLANTDEEIATFQNEVPKLLMRFFWVTALGFGFFSVLYSFVPLDPSAVASGYFSFYAYLNILSTPILGYFAGGSITICTVGLGLFVRRIRQAVDFKPGFILEGGKAALQPFNRLLWAVWGTFTLPVIIAAIFGLSPVVYGSAALQPLDIVSIFTAIVLTIFTIVVPQFFMSQLLEQEKTEELKRLHGELEDIASLSHGADAAEGISRVLRHLHLTHQIQQVQSFSPTLVDARFVIQIAASVTAIIAAQFLLSTVLAGVLS